MRDYPISITAILVFITLLNVLVSCQSQPAKVKDPMLEASRVRWKESNICKYKMTVEVFQLGASTLEGLFEIEVKNGEVVSITRGRDFDNKELEQEQFEAVKNRYKKSLSIQALFDSIESAIDQKALLAGQGKPDVLKLEISYNRQYGYPENLVIHRLDMIHGTSYSKIKNFEILSSQIPCNLESQT